MEFLFSSILNRKGKWNKNMLETCGQLMCHKSRRHRDSVITCNGFKYGYLIYVILTLDNSLFLNITNEAVFWNIKKEIRLLRLNTFRLEMSSEFFGKSFFYTILAICFQVYSRWDSNIFSINTLKFIHSILKI